MDNEAHKFKVNEGNRSDHMGGRLRGGGVAGGELCKEGLKEA